MLGVNLFHSKRAVLVMLFFMTFACFGLYYVIYTQKYRHYINIFNDNIPIYTYNDKKWKIFEDCLNSVRKSSRNNIKWYNITNPEVIVLVNSRVDDYISRCAIRAVWSHYAQEKSYLTYVVYFQVGYRNQTTLQSALYENKLYKDLLIYNNIKESYHNIVLKLTSSLQHINIKYKNSFLKFIVKTDDDVYVNIKDLMVHLYSIKNSNIDYEGLLNVNMPIIRDKNHKNYEPYSSIAGKYFPPYCSGGGYVIRADKLKCLVNSSHNHKNLRNSDANIGYLLQYCQITMRNNMNYGLKSISNFNLASGIDLIRKGTKFFFMHGIKGINQLVFDSEFDYFSKKPFTNRNDLSF